MTKYLDLLTLMKERTQSQLAAFTSSANPWRLYDGQSPDRDITRQMVDALEKQLVDISYLISREIGDK